MANKKITELTNLQTPVANTQFVAVDIENDETKSVTLANLVSVIDTNENQNVVQIQANVASLVDTGGHTLTVSANLIPDADGVYDLGSSSNKWKDLHLTGSSIKLGGITISDLGNEGISITGTSGEKANITTPSAGGVANVALELSDLQSRLTTNVTTFTNEDTALQSRLATNVTTFSNEDTALQSRLTTNVTTFTNEDTALQARLTTNVTAFTNEDTALQARITANNTLLHSNDFITFTRLQANIDLVQDNVASVTVGTAADTETRLDANLDIVQDNVTAVQSRLTTNVTAFTNEDTALQARITANNTLSHSNDFITFTRLNANLDVVQDNVAAIISGTTPFTGDVTLESDDGGSSAAPVIILDRQSASPADADYLGRIQFKGKDDGGSNRLYGQISGKIIDVTAGSEDGAIEFAVRKDGTSTIVARLRSDKLQLLNGTEISVDGSSDFTGTVTMNDEVTMTDDLIVTGNLTVNGTTTTINTTNMDVDDTLIMLANGTTGSPANDIGILFNRGNQGNAAFFYDESAQTFKVSDTKDPTSNTSLSPVTSANLDVGILTAATVKFNGADLSTAISDNVTVLSNEDTALQSRLTTNVTAFTNEDTALQARITANNTLISDLETRRTQNIAGAVSTITTGDLTVSRALVSDGSGKVAVSDITSTELGHLDGIDQNINSNLVALAAGIAGTVVSNDAPTGDYGLLDAANAATDAFGIATAGLTTFDMKTEPAGTVNQQDLGALT